MIHLHIPVSINFASFFYFICFIVSFELFRFVLIVNILLQSFRFIQPGADETFKSSLLFRLLCNKKFISREKQKLCFSFIKPTTINRARHKFNFKVAQNLLSIFVSLNLNFFFFFSHRSNDKGSRSKVFDNK